MAHEAAKIEECERLYVDEGQDFKDIAQATGVSLPTLSRWSDKYKWTGKRKDVLGQRDKVLEISNKLLDRELGDIATDPDYQIDPQRLHAIRGLLDTVQKLSQVRERVVPVDDAEMLLEAMKEIPALKTALDSPGVMAELEKILKYKLKK